ncbi:MerR family transcriptional regulator [Amycolatopsis orientalis]|uniref:MerR family transcriptional regulator n=1 Tax=Amycolatopsis orientalis TaxID=31958 RepID=UPI00039B1F97|nr:MerR family transcriptional regulator [Amycolatopsis orientalis]
MSSATGSRPGTYSIGQVADRLGLPVSTLRWWEKRGLISPSGRQSGRRRYDEADVRRVAMVQLWQAAAAMSLEEIRVFLAGNTDDADWRGAVEHRIAACDRQLAQLASARATLAHLLRCPSDHPADECPYLAASVDEYLATGALPDFSGN